MYGLILTIAHRRPVTRGKQGGRILPRKFFCPLEKYVGHNLKVLDIVWKIWDTLRKLFAPQVSQAGYGPGTSHGVTTNGCVNQCPYAVAGKVTPLSRKIDFLHNATLSRNQGQNHFCVCGWNNLKVTQKWLISLMYVVEAFKNSLKFSGSQIFL